MFLRAIIQLTIGFDKAKEILSNVTIHTHTTPPHTHTHPMHVKAVPAATKPMAPKQLQS